MIPGVVASETGSAQTLHAHASHQGEAWGIGIRKWEMGNLNPKPHYPVPKTCVSL